MFRTAGFYFKFIVVDTAGSLLRFPVWWYNEGLFQILKWVTQKLVYRLRAYGFGIWLRNFFVPMYGQYDLAGRVVSIFMRFFVLIGRFIAFFTEALGYTLLVLLFAALPVLALLFFLSNLFQVGVPTSYVS